MAGTRLRGGGRSSGRTELERELGVVGGDPVATVTPRQADRIHLGLDPGTHDARGHRSQRRNLPASLRGGTPPARAIRRATSRPGAG